MIKKILPIACLVLFSVSCSQTPTDTYKKTIANYLMGENGEKENVKIDLFEIDVITDITVADSIKILNELTETKPWMADNLQSYKKRDTTEVLAKRINAHFSAKAFTSNSPDGIAFRFLLSPDGKECYGMEFSPLKEPFSYQVGQR